MAFVFADFSAAVTAPRTTANTINGIIDDVVAARTNLIDSLEAKGLPAQVATASGILTALITAMELTQTQLVALSEDIILDRTLVTEQLNGLTDETDVDEALRETFEQMIEDVSTTTANVVTVSSVTKDTNVATAGNFYCTKKLPGNVAPGEGFVHHWNLYDRDSEMPEVDTVVAICRNLGTLIVSGKPPQAVPYGHYTIFGNAGAVTIPCDNSGTLITNFFENFTANVPDGWTAVTGAAGTEFQLNAVAATVMRGTNSLRIQGTTELTFPIASLTGLASRQMLLLSVWLLKGTGTTTGTYKFQMTGTGMATQETSAFNATDLSTTVWEEKTLHLKVPGTIPSDLKIKVISTTVDTTDGIYLDGGCLQPYVYWAGLGFAATLGPTDTILGDRYSLTIANDKAGALQTWMARAHGFQLPSA